MGPREGALVKGTALSLGVSAGLVQVRDVEVLRVPAGFLLYVRRHDPERQGAMGTLDGLVVPEYHHLPVEMAQRAERQCVERLLRRRHGAHVGMMFQTRQAG